MIDRIDHARTEDDLEAIGASGRRSEDGRYFVELGIVDFLGILECEPEPCHAHGVGQHVVLATDGGEHGRCDIVSNHCNRPHFQTIGAFLMW